MCWGGGGERWGERGITRHQVGTKYRRATIPKRKEERIELFGNHSLEGQRKVQGRTKGDKRTKDKTCRKEEE